MSFLFALNPVTLKELRQMVRSRLVATGLIAFLLMQLIGVSLVLLTVRSEAHSSAGLYGSALGEGVFHTVYFLLSGIVLLCIPLFMGTRMGIERAKEQLDLQFTTALKPRQFVDGKIASAVVLILMFASASLPFLVLSYLLRGIDLFTVLWSFCGLLVVAVCCLYGILFLGVIGVSRVFRIFLLLGVIFALLFIMGWVNIGSAAWMASGRGLPLSSWDEIAGFALTLLLIVSGCALARVVTVAALSPPHANRGLPVRACITAAWLLWGLVCLAYAGVKRDAGSVTVWGLLSVLAAAVLLAVAASMPGGHSRRVLAAVSPRAWVRLVQFVFFSGVEGGMVWALSLGLCTVASLVALNLCLPHLHNGAELTTGNLSAIFLYLSAIVCSVRAAWVYALKRVLSHRLVGVIALVMVALGSLLPYLLTLDSSAADASHASRWFGNVVSTFDSDNADLRFHIAYSSVWAMLAWSACMPSVFGAFRRFRRPVQDAPVAEAGA